jgi:capsular exopolysaccharide synthesis family protein
LSGVTANEVEPLLRAVRRRWRFILLCVVIGTVAAVALAEREPTEYSASATLLFQNSEFDAQLFGNTPSVQPNPDPTREAATNFELVSLPTVAARTAAALHLNPSEVNVTTAGIGQTDAAQITATDPNPSRAALIANTYARQYVLFRQQANRAKISGAQTLVQTELATLPAAERNGSVGQSLQNRATQLQILAALQTGNAEVVQPAGVPMSPSAPNTKRSALLGGLLSLLLGLGIAFVAERFDRRVRDPSELASAYGVPLLGEIPNSAAIERGRRALPATESEAFALLRARLRYFNVNRDVRSLLITSAAPAEGKTAVALNLAIAEAVSGNTNVVLLEADLRHPAMAERIGIGSVPGLTEVLTGKATLDSALRSIPVPGRSNGNRVPAHFTIVTSGALPQNPSELLESRAMVSFLSELTDRFDLIIIDSSPISIVSDAIPLMTIVAGAVIVGCVGQTGRDAIRHLRQQLAKLNAPILGVVANRASNAGGKYPAYPRDTHRPGPSPAASQRHSEQFIFDPRRLPASRTRPRGKRIGRESR